MVPPVGLFNSLGGVGGWAAATYFLTAFKSASAKARVAIWQVVAMGVVVRKCASVGSACAV